jgi:hypothetical protein
MLFREKIIGFSPKKNNILLETKIIYSSYKEIICFSYKKIICFSEKIIIYFSERYAFQRKNNMLFRKIPMSKLKKRHF